MKVLLLWNKEKRNSKFYTEPKRKFQRKTKEGIYLKLESLISYPKRNKKEVKKVLYNIKLLAPSTTLNKFLYPRLALPRTTESGEEPTSTKKGNFCGIGITINFLFSQWNYQEISKEASLILNFCIFQIR